MDILIFEIRNARALYAGLLNADVWPVRSWWSLAHPGLRASSCGYMVGGIPLVVVESHAMVLVKIICLGPVGDPR